MIETIDVLCAVIDSMAELIKKQQYIIEQTAPDDIEPLLREWNNIKTEYSKGMGTDL